MLTPKWRHADAFESHHRQIDACNMRDIAYREIWAPSFFFFSKKKSNNCDLDSEKNSDSLESVSSAIIPLFVKKSLRYNVVARHAMRKINRVGKSK